MTRRQTDALCVWRQQQRAWTEAEKAAEYIRARQRRLLLDVLPTLLPQIPALEADPQFANCLDDGQMDAKAAAAPLLRGVA